MVTSGLKWLNNNKSVKKADIHLFHFGARKLLARLPRYPAHAPQR